MVYKHGGNFAVGSETRISMASDTLRSAHNSPTKSSAKLDWSSLIDVIEDSFVGNPDKPLELRESLKKALTEYDGELSELARFAMFDSGKNYTRNLIATDNEKYALMLLCWNKGKYSPIHDHPCDGCWVKVIQGEVNEVQYVKDGNVLNQSSDIVANRESGVMFMHDSLGFHKVGNPSTEIDAITLHLYSPPFEKCRLWFDPNDANRSSVAVSCYYSEYGTKNQ